MKVYRKSTAGGSFTQVANSVIQDKRLSLKARGLMVYLLSFPPAWVLNMKGLVTMVGRDGRDSVRSAFHELEAFGYVVRTKPRDPKGRLLPLEYVVYEEPVSGIHPQTAFPATDKPAPVNLLLCNTKASNTESYGKTIEIDSQSSSILPLKESAKATAPIPGSESDVVAGISLRDYAGRVDRAMEQNLDQARSRYWRTLEASVTDGRSFSVVFGQKPRLAWTSAEYGYLKEITQFCVDQWPGLDPLNALELIIRAAFRRQGKARQFLKYWVKHCRGKVSLRPFLTLGGGTQDPAKRLDILKELAAGVDANTTPAVVSAMPMPPETLGAVNP